MLDKNQNMQENKAFARTCVNDVNLKMRQREYDNQMGVPKRFGQTKNTAS